MQQPQPSPHALSARARALYQALFRRASSTPDQDYLAICNAWVAYSGADSVWLWLGHVIERGRTWHLIAHGKVHSIDIPEPNPGCYEASEHPNVVEYAAVSRRAVFVEDPATWQETVGKTTYLVQSQEALGAMGCKSFVTIPLVAPPDKTESSAEPSPSQLDGQESVVGAICLHYRTPLKVMNSSNTNAEFMNLAADPDSSPEPITPTRETLEWMGRFTAIALDHSTDALQRRSLLRLNELAGKHLVASSVTPVEARRKYLEELTRLIQELFHIEGVSLFYRTASDKDRISLLYTTGVCVGDARIVLGEDQWQTLIYGISELNRTSQCFATGKPVALNHGVDVSAGGTVPKSFEVRIRDGTMMEKEWKVPALLLPIPAPVSESSGKEPQIALGVIRFAYHGWKRFGKHNRPFDPVEIQTLMFMVQQIGPVLETMARNIEADKAIADQRHELRDSTRVINQLVDEMSEGLTNPQPDEKREVLAYDLWDLKFSALLAKTQSQRLYRDGMENKKLEIRQIKLYGKIIARLCEVVGRHAAEEKRILLKVDHITFAKLPPLWVDRWYVEQAFFNVLVNAVKYGDENSEIRVWFREEKEGYFISVKNQGIGIRPEDKERIFERGFRSVEAKEEAPGAGLGLTISRLIMRRHGGDVILASHFNPTTFALFFPVKLRFNPPSE